jgi:deazaflavin-dependent oxidoreductase (nitroreductase family)
MTEADSGDYRTWNGGGMTGQPGSDTSRPSRSAVVLGPLSRRINQYVVRVAGRRRSGPLAAIHHVGRRTGQLYVRPVLSRTADETYLIPLFFGTGADWCRNVQAAGGCRLRSRNSIHRLHNPRVIQAAEVRALVHTAFLKHERAALRVAGIKAYLLLDVAPRAAPNG